MPVIRLTEKAIAKLRAPDPSRKQSLHWDKSLKGFGVLVSGVSKAKSYVVQHVLPGGRTRRADDRPDERPGVAGRAQQRGEGDQGGRAHSRRARTGRLLSGHRSEGATRRGHAKGRTRQLRRSALRPAAQERGWLSRIRRALPRPLARPTASRHHSRHGGGPPAADRQGCGARWAAHR